MTEYEENMTEGEYERKLENEHGDFLRKVANNDVYKLVSDPVNLSRFRHQLELFCENIKAHNEELTQLKNDYDSNEELQKAWQDALDSPDGPLYYHAIDCESGLGCLKDYEDYVWHNPFWGPPTKTADFLCYLTSPPARVRLAHRVGREYCCPADFSREPDDREKLMCSYALLTAIHDSQITEKRIFTSDPNIKLIWCEKYNWIDRLWENCNAVSKFSEDDLKNIRVWIERALFDVKRDLSGKSTPREAGQDNQEENPVQNLAEEIPEERKSPPMSIKRMAECWGGDMTPKKLSGMIKSGRVKTEKFNRQTYIFDTKDLSPEAKRKIKR